MRSSIATDFLNKAIAGGDPLWAIAGAILFHADILQDLKNDLVEAIGSMTRTFGAHGLELAKALDGVAQEIGYSAEKNE